MNMEKDMKMPLNMDEMEEEMVQEDEASPKDKILEEFAAILGRYFPDSKEEAPVGDFDKLMMAHKKGME